MDCNDDNVCTTDTCDETDGCENANNTDVCDDSDGCTGNDVCSGGVCAGTECELLDQICHEGSCKPGTCGAVRLDGLDDWIAIPSTGETGGRTIEGWLLFSDGGPPEGKYNTLLHSGCSGISIKKEQGNVKFGVQFHPGCGGNGVNYRAEFPTSVAFSTWVSDWKHLAVVSDGVSTATFYLDGIAVASGPLAWDSQSSTQKGGIANQFEGAPQSGNNLGVDIAWFALSDTIRYSGGSFAAPDLPTNDSETVLYYDFTSGESGQPLPAISDEAGGDHLGTLHGGDWLTGASACIDGAICGDATVASWEDCDDGNNSNGDGCSGECESE